MMSDQRLREEFDRFDMATPRVDDELHAVRQLTARRRRARRAAWVVGPLVALACVVVGLEVSQGGGRSISSRPPARHVPPALVPSTLPWAMKLVAVQGPSRGFGRSGDRSVELRRTYVELDANRSRVERQFFVDVGRGAGSAEMYQRTSGEPTQVRGVPAKLYSDGTHSDLTWVDTTGLVLRVGGDLSAADAVAVAEGLVLDPASTDDARLAQARTVPDGFEHFLDQFPGRKTTNRGHYQLWYATPNRDATLQIDLRRFPTATVREQLLAPGARVVDVRGQRGVFYEQPGIERSLRWMEPSGTLVTLTATTATEDQLRQIARSLRPINGERWRHLSRTTPPLGAQESKGANPRPTVPRLAPIGPEVVAAEGSIGRTTWQLVVYEVAPAPDQPERRFCYELRGERSPSQSCFPLRPDGVKEKWLYAERDLGRWFLLGATAKGAPTELTDARGTSVALQRFDEPALPVQVLVTVLPDRFEGRLTIPDGGWSSIGIGGPAPGGTRQPMATPGLPGVYPEFAPALFRPAPPAIG